MKKLTTSEFISKARLKHGTTYDYGKCVYVRTSEKVVITCKKHGDFKQIPSSHLQGKGCPKCGKTKTKDTSTFITQSRTVHGNTYDYGKCVYVRNKEKVVITCKKHGDFKQEASSHLKGSGCPKCKASKGEAKILEYLKKHKVKYQTQKTFPDLKGKVKLRYDFYIVNQNILIEYDGAQHFKPVSVWGGLDAFKETMRHDDIKDAYARNNGYNLIRIPYTRFDEIDTILHEYLIPNF